MKAGRCLGGDDNDVWMGDSGWNGLVDKRTSCVFPIITLSPYTSLYSAIPELTHQDPTTHTITDMISFYSLPSSIMKHATHRVLNAAYLYYYASDTIFRPSSGGPESATAESSASASAYESHKLGLVEERKRREKLGERLNLLSGDLLTVAKNVSLALRANVGGCVGTVDIGQDEAVEDAGMSARERIGMSRARRIAMKA